MIHYDLVCRDGHRFDGWFRSSDDFDLQNGKHHVSCPHCGGHEVEKAMMAPGIARRSGEAEPRKMAAALPPEMAEAIRKLRRHVETNAENVGRRFPEEARKIHYNEADPRGIYGEASMEEASALAEEGIEVQPLPMLPEDSN